MWLSLYNLLVCATVVCCIISGNDRQYFISEPSDLIGTAGETLVLPCRVGGRQGQCQWTRDGLGLGVELDLPAYPRFTMSPDSCDLTMFPILPQDEGVYECQVLAVPGSAPLTSQPAQVTVLSEPGQPHISQATLGDVLEVAVGEKITLECESLGGKPAADIQWSYADGTVLSDNVSQQTDMMEDKKTYRTVSHVNIKAIHDMSITCTATSTAFQTKKTSMLNIRLLHKPQVHLSLDTDSVREGITLEITCSAEVYPALTSYRWFINRQEIRGEQERTLRIEKISRAYNQVQIMCRGSNKVGQDEASKVLTVEFAPKVVTHPTDTFAKDGDIVTFHCAGAGNPPPAYVWINNNSREVLGFTQNFTTIASSATELEYVCRVFSDGFLPAESRPAKLGVLRRPDILTVSYKETGKAKLIHCSVKSASKETNITWLKDGNPIINIGKDEHEIIYTNDVLFHHSYIMFKSKPTEDVKYSCFAWNEAGTDIQDAPLFNSDSNVIYILVPVIGMVILVIILVSVVVAIFKRIQRASVEKMEQEKKLQFLAVESQPCLSTCNNTNLGFVKGGLSPNVSWHSFNTISSVLANSVNSEHSSKY